MYTPEYKTCLHLEKMLDTEKLKMTIEKCIRVLTKQKGNMAVFDAIAFSGMSGALIAPSIAMRMNKSLIMVRKPSDNTHSQFRIEGDKSARRYIVLDDFISLGKTVRRIVEGVQTFCRETPYCVGVLQANRDEDTYDIFIPSYICCHITDVIKPSKFDVPVRESRINYALQKLQTDLTERVS